MKTKKTMDASSDNKTKCFDGLIDESFTGIDPSYKLYLEHLRKDGNAFVLDLPDGDHGKPVSVRYEEDDTPPGDTTGKKDPKNASKDSVSRSHGVPNGELPGVTAGKAASVNEEKKQTFEVDESYALFLSLVKFQDGYMVIEPEPGVTIVYEKDEAMHAGNDELKTGCSRNEPENMEVDGAQADKIPSEHEKAGHPSEDLDDQDVICTDARGSRLFHLNAPEDGQGAALATFEEKLIAISSQPYDQDEYEELWRKATDRKPVSKQRILRGASKHYFTKTPGLSYLDHYPELGIQINAGDRDEKLRLLRQFFFWLENLCHPGAYMPWMPKTQASDPILPDDYEPTPRSGQ